MPLADIKSRLTAYGLSADGTKRTLSKRLHQHIRTLPPPEPSPDPPSSPASSETHGLGTPPNAGDQEQSPRSRRARSRSPLTAADLRALKTLLRRRPHGHRRQSRSTSGTPSSDESHTSSTSSSGSSREATPSPRRSRSRRDRSRRHRRSHSRSPRDHRHRVGHRRSRRHRRSRARSSSRDDGHSADLPPIPDRLRGRIRRGEFVDLSVLLQTNLTMACRQRGAGSHNTRDPKHQERRATISDFTSWVEAWSTYSTVLTSYYPHLAPRLFQYQHFLALKSRAFQQSAWLRYDTEFRLKLAANSSWLFHVVDTELWASCFAADGLACTPPQAQTPQTCFACGSATHFYAQCPHRRQPGNFRPPPPTRADNPKPPTPSGKEQPPSLTRDQRELCMIFNDKGRCFRGPRCPYAHTCAQCGGQHSKRACPHISS